MDNPSSDMCHEFVDVQLQKPQDEGEPLPIVRMKVVRVSQNGIGLMIPEVEDE